MIPVRAKSVVKYGGKWHVPGDRFSETFSVTEEWLGKYGQHVEVVEPPVAEPQSVAEVAVPTTVMLPAETPWLEVLVTAGISTVADLRAVDDLLSLPGIGTKRAEEIRAFLEALG